jgi:TIR domain
VLQVFISYGHADMEPFSWIDRLRLYLRQNRHEGAIEIWDDSKISPGTDWRHSIATALNHCHAAILLVGPAFLASEFVMSNELPSLLAAARTRGVKIFPVVIMHAAYRQSVLEPFDAVNNPDEPLEAMSAAEQNRILNQLAIDVDTALRSSPAGGSAVGVKGDDTSTAVKAIQRQLSTTWTTFVAQAHRRDDLVAALERRLRKKLDLEYEKLFFRYYKELIPEERFEFDQIRAMTEGPLYDGNRKILDLLEAQPHLVDEIPMLTDLRQHLVFWLNKFDRVFRVRPEMCLLYTGVEDAVPFPGGLDRQIDEWLLQNAKDAKQ